MTVKLQDAAMPGLWGLLLVLALAAIGRDAQADKKPKLLP